MHVSFHLTFNNYTFSLQFLAKHFLGKTNSNYAVLMI